MTILQLFNIRLLGVVTGLVFTITAITCRHIITLSEYCFFKKHLTTERTGKGLSCVGVLLKIMVYCVGLVDMVAEFLKVKRLKKAFQHNIAIVYYQNPRGLIYVIFVS